MAKKNFVPLSKDKCALGKLITALRTEKNISLRKLADAIELSPSNLSYIENGTNVPTAELYQKIIEVLTPPPEKHRALDRLYTAIRNAPPPDACEVLLQNAELVEKIRLLKGVQLSPQQLKTIEELFTTFKKQQGDN